MVVAERVLNARAVTPCGATPRKHRTFSDAVETVSAAADGEPLAWAALTRRFGGMVMAIARSCRLNEADLAEVHQVTWLRMVENIDRIEKSERVGAWSATTAKRESLRIVRSKQRATLDYEALLDRADAKEPDDGPITREQVEMVRKACALLPPHCRRLLNVLAADGPPWYKEISNFLSMPIGSIGPTRGRCLEHLRRIIGPWRRGLSRRSS